MSSDPFLPPGNPGGPYQTPFPGAVPPARGKRPWASSIIILVCAVALAIAALVAGIVVGVTSLSNPKAGYALGRSATVPVDESGTQAIFADQSIAFDVSCTATGPDGSAVDVSKPFTSVEVSANGHDWKRVGEFEAKSAGNYVVTCKTTGDVSGSFGVSKAPNTQRFVISLVGGIGGFLVLMAAGVITFLVRMLRRPKVV